ncbi:MAG: hypothetical protein H8E80_04830 [Desulfobacteraceae bacterium]|uniref:Uncharacterized protein n=1 Tax=Candidatus Desulfaltia bathyphila TaxID=2841697 RepID=A0A8J6N5N3_9BACT|nr:hypothetical protein [Candidatus Desulfaltia bathyphila]
MAVKRVTIEIDDVSDLRGSTELPSTLVRKKNVPVSSQQTDIPDRQNYNHESQVAEKYPKILLGSKTIGRTPSDLVFAFINRPEFMATILTFLAFLLFIKSLKTFHDFLMPVGAAILFNIVWFSISTIRRFSNWFRSKKV